MGLNLLELYWSNWHDISNCTELLELIWMWPWTLALLSKLTTWYQLLELVLLCPSWTWTLLNNLTSWYLELQWTVDMGLNATFLNYIFIEQMSVGYLLDLCLSSLCLLSRSLSLSLSRSRDLSRSRSRDLSVSLSLLYESLIKMNIKSLFSFYLN